MDKHRTDWINGSVEDDQQLLWNVEYQKVQSLQGLVLNSVYDCVHAAVSSSWGSRYTKSNFSFVKGCCWFFIKLDLFDLSIHFQSREMGNVCDSMTAADNQVLLLSREHYK
ncbi:hypothetical protein CHARACLAT_004352 [Characodon lateralis]|uniref:Uncharacterized protein n=1 Tax=Characodon lateralis TaxID=208331 RepID=A0ABU7CNH8_9TELE|nr:hypothetical protein [Characodon lateralis]